MDWTAVEEASASAKESKGANEVHQIEWLTLSQLEHRRSFQLLTSMPKREEDAEVFLFLLVRIELYGWTMHTVVSAASLGVFCGRRMDSYSVRRSGPGRSNVDHVRTEEAFNHIESLNAFTRPQQL